MTKDVPPYTIVGGVPAKAIRKRFSEQFNREISARSWRNGNTVPRILSGVRGAALLDGHI